MKLEIEGNEKLAEITGTDKLLAHYHAIEKPKWCNPKTATHYKFNISVKINIEPTRSIITDIDNAFFSKCTNT